MKFRIKTFYETKNDIMVAMKQDSALEILKSGKNVFITGSAGTGKTYLLNQYLDFIKSRKINPAITAPTGIAASHLNGATIHSFFGLGIRDSVDQYYVDGLMQKKYLNDRLAKLKILVIDEISMVSPEIFGAIDEILRAFKFNDDPFGGVQVIVSGDFFQLPPVSKVRKVKRFAWQSPVWRDVGFKTCYLEEKFRQAEGDSLIQILDEIRTGEVSEDSYQKLQDSATQDLDKSFRPTKLYTHNIDVDSINQKELDCLDGSPRIFDAQAKGSKKNIEKIFKTSLVLPSFSLKKDAVVIFIKNNYEKGYINGTTGKVVAFDDDTKMPIIEIFSGRKIVTAREDWSFEDENGKIKAVVSQVPLRLAWAITIHKSQGMTLDTVEVDLSKTFEPGQGYVALSRVKSLDGLRLSGFNNMALQVDPLILMVDEKMKTASNRAEEENEEMEEHREEIEEEFIQNAGGTIDEKEIKEEEKKVKKQRKKEAEIIEDIEPRVSTYTLTLEKVASAKSIKDLADVRAFSEDTIIKHLRVLKEKGEEMDIEKFKPENDIMDSVQEAYDELKDDSKNYTEGGIEEGQIKLKPIFDMLDGQVQYDDIKVALLFV